MWNVKDGKLTCGGDTVSVRRGVVKAVLSGAEGVVAEEKVRRMIAMERALTLLRLAAELGRATPAR